MNSTSKDLRTWAASLTAAAVLESGELCDALGRHREGVRDSHPRELSVHEATLLGFLAE